ncbi:OFA family MFS transporter [uncultured Paludibaculum sp.]|uniref:L-lactate MFS transporter n=1 Tax=uncultured Paludibaculum sp. TaxID=1765020 RepID=UPI002AABAAD4|nr:OFA family MFS transporter [uncultured Paludibaculum sp.]
MSSTISTPKSPNRWLIAAAGVAMQIALGAVYAWSVFRTPLMKEFHWTITEVSLTFTITIFTLGCAAFAGGLWMRAKGPRVVGLTGGLLYGLGVTLASQSNHGLWVLYLSYGLIGGAGIGLSYIVPVATLVKWFPDRRGFITGVAVAGFGAGALVTAPIATRLIASVGVLSTFAVLGIASFLLVAGSALLMREPPAGYRPEGWVPAKSGGAAVATDFTLRQAVGAWQWYALWAMLFLNVSAGIAIISQASPMVQEISGVGAATAATMVGIISIANGAGRFLWAWLSDAIGRRWVFLAMFLLQALLFVLLPSVTGFGLFTTLCVIILLCYGGGFGTMPAFCADYFGAKDVGSIYGLMLTAWGCGSVLGPVLIARIRQTTGHYDLALYILAGILAVSAILPFLVRPPVRAQAGTVEGHSEPRAA